jgi:glycosyltransferase involved in cell wall biosynthesis
VSIGMKTTLTSESGVDVGTNTSAPIVVQTLFMNRYLASRNTDYQYFLDLQRMEEHSQLRFRSCPMAFPNLIANGSIGIDWTLRHIGLRDVIYRSGPWSRMRRRIWVPRRLGRDCDVIYSNYFLPVNRLRIPFVLEWDFSPYGLEEEWSRMHKILDTPARVLESSAAIIVRHDLSRDELLRQCPAAEEKCWVMPAYIPDLEVIAESAMARKFQALRRGDQLEVLFVGHAALRKGLPALIEAWEMALAEGLSVRLTVVSSFRDGRVRLAPTVRLLSNVPHGEVLSLMKKAHIFAMPSRVEAVGKAFYEAIANGCALIYPNTNPQRCLFKGFGEAVDPREPNEILRALRLLADPVKAERFARAGRVHFASKCHHDIVSRQYRLLFAEASGRRRGEPGDT